MSAHTPTQRVWFSLISGATSSLGTFWGLLLNSHSQLLDFLLDGSFHFTLLQGVLHKESFQDERHEDAERNKEQN